nr:hypothetical protein SYMBAF_110238 [Serratia symbiotica]
MAVSYSDIRQNITLKLRLFGQDDAVKQGVVEPITKANAVILRMPTTRVFSLGEVK